MGKSEMHKQAQITAQLCIQTHFWFGYIVAPAFLGVEPGLHRQKEAKQRQQAVDSE